MLCTESRVMYVRMTCNVCKKIVYIQETSRTVNDRLKKHNKDIRH